MKYHNLVYAKHHEFDKRAYLYELPMDMSVKRWERLCVKDNHGEHIVSAFSENFVENTKMTRLLCLSQGGYFPPAKVIGTVNTVLIRQEVVDKFNGQQEEVAQ